jgi:pre-mRNA-splicing factor CDC5/CEF1
MVPEEAEDTDDETADLQEDAAERDARLKREEEERKRKEFNRRSIPVQKGYPRLPNVNPSVLQGRLDRTVGAKDEGAYAEAQALINEELARLAMHDSIAFPLPGTVHAGSTTSTYIHPDDDAREEAKRLIEREIAESLGYPSMTGERIKEGLSVLIKDQPDAPSGDDPLSSWSGLRATLSYDPREMSWTEPGSLDEATLISGISSQLEGARNTMAREAVRAAKIERKLGTVLGGYQTRAEALRKKLEDGYTSLSNLKADLDAFENLRAIEGLAGPHRLEKAHEEAGKLERREGMLQGRYKELLEERDRLLKNIGVLEEKVMEQAEEMNMDG